MCLTLMLFFSCGSCGSDDDDDVAPGKPYTVSWNANREKAVNSSGGGYRVYYSQVQGFDISNAAFVDVPWVSGQTPTTADITLTSGTWFIKVTAYSALNGGSNSKPSEEQRFITSED